MTTWACLTAFFMGAYRNGSSPKLNDKASLLLLKLTIACQFSSAKSNNEQTDRAQKQVIEAALTVGSDAQELAVPSEEHGPAFGVKTATDHVTCADRWGREGLGHSHGMDALPLAHC
jgi:hypothetical protein